MGTRMKVLLTQNVENVGQAGDIKEVSGGYGRNYLIPKGFAILATRGQIKQAEERLSSQRKREASVRGELESVAAKLRGVTLRFVERVGTDGRLYGSVTNADVAAKIQQELGLEVDRRRIDLEDPIKRVGHYPVTIRLMTGVEAVVNVLVGDESGANETQTDVSAAEPETAGEDTLALDEDV